MRAKEVTRKEIENKILNMGDYVRIDYLSSCLRNNLDFDTRKFVLVKLSGLYKDKSMFLDAAKAMKAGAEINVTSQNKIDDFLGACELFIKAGNYNDAEICIKYANNLAGKSQKIRIEQISKEFYNSYAKNLFRLGKRKHALEAYNRILALNLCFEERRTVQMKILELYDKLGNVKEYYNLKKQLK